VSVLGVVFCLCSPPRIVARYLATGFGSLRTVSFLSAAMDELPHKIVKAHGEGAYSINASLPADSHHASEPDPTQRS